MKTTVASTSNPYWVVPSNAWPSPIWPSNTITPTYITPVPFPVDPDAFHAQSLELIEMKARLAALEKARLAALEKFVAKLLKKQLDPFAPVKIILPGEA